MTLPWSSQATSLKRQEAKERVKAQTSVNHLLLPAVVFALFNTVTYVMFLYGPLKWSIGNELALTGFLLAYWVFYALGYTVGLQAPAKSAGERVGLWVKRHLMTLLVISFLTFASAIYIYTGEVFWNTTRIFGDQQENYYRTLQYAKRANGVLDLLFIFLKTFLQPVITLAIIYSTLNFKKLKPIFKIGVLTVYLIWILFSVFRGTDKEIFDIAVIFLTCMSVNYFRSSDRKLTLLGFGRSVLFMGAAVFVLVGFLSLFSQRKLSRMGGNTAVCIAEARVCARSETPLEYMYAMTTAYASHGYYGMSLALEQPFDSTFPFGHAPALKPISDAVIGPNYLDRSYLNKIDRQGWDNGIRWSTAYTSWANDNSFWLVPFVMFFVGLITALSWKDAVMGHSLLGVTVFSFMGTTSLFLSANNQVGISLDSLLAFVAVMLAWLVARNYKIRW